jgi:hypothetical protein
MYRVPDSVRASAASGALARRIHQRTHDLSESSSGTLFYASFAARPCARATHHFRIPPITFALRSPIYAADAREHLCMPALPGLRVYFGRVYFGNCSRLLFPSLRIGAHGAQYIFREIDMLFKSAHAPLFGALLALVAFTAEAATATPAEIAFWQSVQNSKNPAEYQAYVSAFPHGMFVAVAAARITPGNQR